MTLMKVASCMVVVGVIGVLSIPANGAPNPNKAAVKCRNAVGRSVLALAKTGLKSIGACHKARNKTGSDRDCNALDPGTNVSSPYGRAFARAQIVIGNACGTDGNPIPALFPGQDITGILLPTVTDLLERTASRLQGAPVFTGDPDLKAKRKCHAAIGAAPPAVMVGILKAATRCQKKLDKRATTFGPIAPECIPGSTSAAGRMSGKISKKCGSIAGLDVGSCAAIPGCVIDEAVARGQALARFAYGGPTECGNGAQELGEECDDGNQANDDGCTSRCALPGCGDGVVSGTEECDDGNDIPTDACNNCQNPVCGDGILAVGVEECDDSNATANDGCTDCVIDPLFCGNDGVVANVIVPYDNTVLTAGIVGIKVSIAYPNVLSIPGTLIDTDQSRFTDLTDVQTLFLGVDRDGTVEVNKAGSSESFDPGDFAGIRFDCVPGSALRPNNFTCTVLEAAEPLGEIAGPGEIPCAISSLSLPGGGTTTSTTIAVTTTTSPVPTTTTTIPLNCGNSNVDVGESCDDGNTSDNDACPSDCRIDACTPNTGSDRPVEIRFASPPGINVAGITLLLDYPEGKINLPGSGNSIPDGIIADFPSGASGTPNDFDHALRELVTSPFAMPNGRLFNVHFETCSGAAAPSVGEFSCTVLEASNPSGDDVSGVTCSVVIP